jgi:hypothetical protein
VPIVPGEFRKTRDPFSNEGLYGTSSTNYKYRVVTAFLSSYFCFPLFYVFVVSSIGHLLIISNNTILKHAKQHVPNTF